MFLFTWLFCVCSTHFLVPDLEDLELGWSMTGTRPPDVDTTSHVMPSVTDSGTDSTMSTDLSTGTTLSSGMLKERMFFFLCVSLSACLSLCVSVCLNLSVSVWMYLSLSLSGWLSVCLSLSLSLCLSPLLALSPSLCLSSVCLSLSRSLRLFSLILLFLYVYYY